jgi:hypothetical protein
MVRMHKKARWWQGRAAWVILAALAATQSGCLAAAAGCAAGAGAGYAYYKGKLDRDYVANRDDVWAALHTSLGELQMPVVKEEREPDEDSIETRTADGDKVKIYVDVHKSSIPAEGDISRVSIRVATWGDSTVSSRVFDQVDRHLMPGVPVQGQPIQPVSATGVPPPPTPSGAPPQSAAPPLARGSSGKP